MHDALKNLDKLLSDAERERDAALARVRELEGAGDYDEAAYNLLYEKLEGAERERDEAERERDAARKEGKDALLRAIAAERERDALKVRLEKVRAAFEGLDAPGAKVAASAPVKPKAAPIVADDLNADQRAILAALTPEWQTVLQLHKSAVEHGFSKGNQTVRNYMLRGLASRDGIETRETPLAWRLKGTPPEGGDKITTHEQAIMRVITTEPQSFDNIWTAAAKVYCGGKAGVYNSTLRAKLKELTDAGRLIRSGVRGAYHWRLNGEDTQ